MRAEDFFPLEFERNLISPTPMHHFLIRISIRQPGQKVKKSIGPSKDTPANESSRWVSTQGIRKTTSISKNKQHCGYIELYRVAGTPANFE